MKRPRRGGDTGAGGIRLAPALLALLVASAEACSARRASSAAPPPAPPPPSAAATSADAPPPPSEPGSVVAELRDEARRLRPLIRADWVRALLDATAGLPPIAPRTLLVDGSSGRAASPGEAAAMSADERAKWSSRVLDERYYYTTRYGTPLAYARPLDIVAAMGFRPEGRRILDFGYGGIGHLRLLASLGAEVCGVEVDPLLRALYSEPTDQGEIAGGGGRGRLRLVDGRFPADERVRLAVGDGYDLFLSKNVLKNGYIHPDQPVPERQRVTLGVEDAAFVGTLFRILRPGGLALIYNLSPAPNGPGLPYRPWADGRCPFPPPLWERAGFRVIELDRDDSGPAREMAHALGWDEGEGAMKLDTDLYSHYTLVEKPRD